jgi:excisionase family DNA binding protein
MKTITAVEAAKYLGLSVQRVRLLAAQGRIKHTKHGKAYVFQENPVIEPPKARK